MPNVIDDLYEGGQFLVVFTNNQSAILKIVQCTFEASGHPMFLYTEDGTGYNFRNVLSIKKRDTVIENG